VLSIQKAQFDIEMAREAAVPSPPVRAAIGGQKLSDNSRVLDVLVRYEVAFDRQFSRAVNMLMKIRSSECIFDAPEEVAATAPRTGDGVGPADGLREPETSEFPNEPKQPHSERANTELPRLDTISWPRVAFHLNSPPISNSVISHIIVPPSTRIES
jgi:hypothetical protein